MGDAAIGRLRRGIRRRARPYELDIDQPGSRCNAVGMTYDDDVCAARGTTGRGVNQDSLKHVVVYRRVAATAGVYRSLRFPREDNYVPGLARG